MVYRLVAILALALLMSAGAARAERPAPEEALRTWYRLVLELVRHTPTYSPPVASRAFAYLGVAGFETAASVDPSLTSLSGQLNGLGELPDPDGEIDAGVAVNAALAQAVPALFANTGPTGQRAMKAMGTKLSAGAADGLDPAFVARSEAHGRAVAASVLAWSQTDGGAVVENMGFPLDYAVATEPGRWVPTNLIRQQQAPLLPRWGEVRTFAMPTGASCGLPPPPAYSEDPGSAFYAEAREVYDAVRGLTPDQRAIARFWSDDPMLSPTPPGHWISIALGVLDEQKRGLADTADILARLGIALADGFIGCWHAKFEFDLIRPITYIRKHIDPAWEPLLNTPPFPEYPSGHSTQSGAAAVVLTAFFGPGFAFEDRTHADDGLEPRRYASFWEAAEEAGISRLYGGIHFRAAIERGLDQGRCIGAHAAALKTREH